MERLCLRPKDVSLMIGISERYARNILQKILKTNGKQRPKLVTVEEFSDYYGLDPNEVRKRLK